MPGTVLRAEASEEGAESLRSSSSDGRSRHANKSVQVQPGRVGMGGPEYLGENFLRMQNHVDLLSDWDTGSRYHF